MKFNGKRYLICDCEGTMDIDGPGLSRHFGKKDGDIIHTALCGSEREIAARAFAENGDPIVVACRHQEALFRKMAAEAHRDDPIQFVDIRESAGWSERAGDALPKIAALLAAAVDDPVTTDTMTLTSEGRCLVYGRDQTALDAAARLAQRLDVTLLLDTRGSGDSIVSTDSVAFPIFSGRVVTLSGYLGRFDLRVDGYAAVSPSSRGGLGFGATHDGATASCDIVVDLSGGTPLLPGGERRHGYLRPDPGNPAAVERALFDAVGLVGEFEKPVYVNYRPDRCAHARNGLQGCTRCLDACPLSAISPDKDVVAIDAGICDGCALCHSVCPTGAATYFEAAAERQGERMRSLLLAYRDAGGKAPVVLIHDKKRGAEAIRLMSHCSRGLPAHVLPFIVDEPGQAGLDLTLPALAFGATRVILVADPAAAAGNEALRKSVSLACAVTEGLGYGAGRVRLWEDIDPIALEEWLYDDVPDANPAAAGFRPAGQPRDVIRLALGALHDAAPRSTDAIDLPDGAPFGAISVDQHACTLCLACVPTCPTGALGDNPEMPQLTFVEDCCVQCGLCHATCPEGAITLAPRLRFGEDTRRPSVLKEEEPFECVRCGTPFGTRASIERVVAQLAGSHPIFRDPAAADRLKMCGDCRVNAQFNHGAEPFQGAAPPRARTAGNDGTDDVSSGGRSKARQ